MTKPKIDFETLIPEPPPIPETPTCEAAGPNRWDSSAQKYKSSSCCAKSHYRVGGKTYCKRHAPLAALDYLRQLALD